MGWRLYMQWLLKLEHFHFKLYGLYIAKFSLFLFIFDYFWVSRGDTRTGEGVE